MKTAILKSSLITAFFFGLIFMGVQHAGAVKVFGVDSYSIYLNGKLLVTHSLDKPLSLTSLKLTEANASDELMIRYHQCNAPDKIGKGRSISVRDESGNIVREWRFTDTKGNAEMVIPVKELLNAQKQASGTLVLYYSAEGRSHQKLAAL